MRVILCGGGTAGHVTPAIAIAEGILAKIPDAKILFVGREGGEENQAVKNKGFELRTVKICGFERKISLKNFKNLKTAVSALRKAKSIIKEFSPDAVIGTGGYVCWPVIKAAQGMKIPTLIHESNACPGLSARLLAKRCDRVLLNLQGSQKEFKKQSNIRIVGNPVRDEFLTQNKKAARKKLRLSDRDFFILSLGGSGGSKKINDSIIEFMQSHSTKNPNIAHIHVCGRKYFGEIKKAYHSLTSGVSGCVIKPYSDDMANLMAAADLIISRAGAMTLAEISAVGVAAILIPSPNVTGNHQYKNAKLICEQNGAVMIEESELCERKLSDTVKKIENDMRYRKTLASEIKKFFVPDAKEKITNEIISLTESNLRNR